MAPQRPKPPAKKKKERAALEALFLGTVLAEVDVTIACVATAAARFPGVSWRHFIDRRHQALWRALQTLDLPDMDERVNALIAERGIADGDLDDNPKLWEALYRQADGIEWFEHELAASGVLPLAGGKAYVRELCGKYLAEMPLGIPSPGIDRDIFARRLGFAAKEEG